MGRVEKGVNCSVLNCGQAAERSISESKAKLATDLEFSYSNKRVYLCRTHYKEWKKDSKDERETERARWN
ncbi:MAG: hypothetical protein DA328_05215 [Nitrososphaeraceae archaeon]|nr:hypothetical protein [Nitrososphaeraceae archaeon]